MTNSVLLLQMRKLSPNRLRDLLAGGKASIWAVSSECGGIGAYDECLRLFCLALEMVCFPSAFSFKPHHCHRPHQKTVLTAFHRLTCSPTTCIFPLRNSSQWQSAFVNVFVKCLSLLPPLQTVNSMREHCLMMCLCLVIQTWHHVGTMNVC